MVNKILVVDDLLRERRSSYERIEKISRDEEDFRSYNIKLVYATSPDHTYSLLEHDSFSAAILDIVLVEWNDYPVLEIINRLPDKMPIVLVTSHWNSNEVKRLLHYFPDKNIRMFLHWDDIEDNQRIEKEGSIKRILYTLTRYIDNYKKSDYSIVLDENEPIRIIHFSDMQFGGVDKDAEYLNVNHCSDTIKRKWDKGPTFIAITGDITQRGLPEEYDAAYKWLKSLISNFSWPCPSNRVFLVPGNHDICLPLATSSLLQLQKKENKKHSLVEEVVDFVKDRNSPIDSLIDYAMQPYLQFCSKLTNITYINEYEDITLERLNRYSYLWLETKFRYLNLVFFGLNSSQPIIPGRLSKREIPKVTVEKLISEIKKLLDENSNFTPIFIGLTHHYPLDRQNAIDNPDVFSQLFNDIPSVALWLHGHWHKRETTDHPIGNGRLVINSAPTLFVKEKDRPQDTLRGFSMIEIQRENSKITGCKIYPVEFVNHGLIIREQEGKKYRLSIRGYFQELD